MNRHLPWTWMTLVACAVLSCTVPTVADLAKAKARACNAERGCGPGYLCVAGTCEALETCTAGAVRVCGLSEGECETGEQACVDGYWGECAGAVSPTPEVCDGKDNDCDGRIDAWEVLNVSGSPAVTSRRAMAAPLGAGRVLVMYEEGGRVVSRRVESDNTLSEAVSPSITADLATRSEGLALAADGDVVAAAWLEEIATSRRVMFATLDEQGRSNLSAGGTEATAVNVAQPLAFIALDLAVDAAAGTILVAVVDAGQLSLWRYSTALPSPPEAQRKNLAGNVRSVKLAPAGGGSFWLTWISAAGLGSRCLVDAETVECAPELSTTALALRGVGADEGYAYAVSADDAGYSVASSHCARAGRLDAGTGDGGVGEPDGGTQDAGTQADGGWTLGLGLTCLEPAAVQLPSGTVRVEEVAVTGTASRGHLLMQVRAPAARPQIEWGLFKPAPSRNAGGGELGLGVRPHAIFLDDRAAAVAWDTDESRLRDDTAEVWLQRLCVQ